jgi:hypothetical protein
VACASRAALLPAAHVCQGFIHELLRGRVGRIRPGYLRALAAAILCEVRAAHQATSALRAAVFALGTARRLMPRELSHAQNRA